MINSSWRTTFSAAVGAIAGLIAFLSTQGVIMPHWLVLTAGFITVGGFASLGIAAKDSSVHSTVAQTQQATHEEMKTVPIPPAVLAVLTDAQKQALGVPVQPPPHA